MLETIKLSLHPEALIAFALYMIAAGIFVSLFAFIYTRITPHKEFALIRDGNTAASIAFGGALLGFALPVNSVITYSTSIVDAAVWAAIACLVQLIAYFIASCVIRSLSARIRRDEVSAGIFMAFISVTAGMLNAACMVPDL